MILKESRELEWIQQLHIRHIVTKVLFCQPFMLLVFSSGHPLLERLCLL